MKTHLRYEGQVRTETDTDAIANLVRKGWEIFTPEPVVESPPTYTPEQWVSQHLSPLQVAALSEFRMALLQAAKPLGPNMTALKSWLEAMMLSSVDPNPRSDWQQPPCDYATASSEAVSDIAG